MKFISIHLLFFVLPSLVYAQQGLSYEKDFKLKNGEFCKVYRPSDSLVTEEFLHQVEALDLSDIKARVPSWVFTMDSLVYLNLGNKGLDFLPNEVCRLKQLKVLFLSENHFEKIPDCLYNMQSLEVITIIGCKMDSVSMKFANLKRLKVFGVGGNNYTRNNIEFIKQELPDCRVVESVD